MRKYHEDMAKHYREQADSNERSVEGHNSNFVTLPPNLLRRMLHNIPVLRRFSKLHKAQTEKYPQGS